MSDSEAELLIHEEDVYRDSKCDDCNCAMRDCSLCGVVDDDCDYLYDNFGSRLEVD